MKKIFFLFAFALLSFAISPASAQNLKPLPEELRAFFLPGHKALDFDTGDLNADGKPDAVLILKVQGENEKAKSYDDSPLRPLLILVRQKDGKLKEVARNDHIVLCAACGGVFGDPYAGITITKDGVFSVTFYGGSSDRWSKTLVFGWQKTSDKWLLLSEDDSETNVFEPEKEKNYSIQADEMLTPLFLTDFDSHTEVLPFLDETWQVQVPKTFFYESPELNSKPQKAFLLKGDSITVSGQTKNFVKASFINDKGQITTGFLLKKDVKK